MAETCTLELADPPLELDFETLRSAPLEVFFVLGYRPALAPEVVLVAAVGEATPGERQPLVWAKLDPFAQRVRQIGWFTPGERWNPLQVFAPLLQGLGEDVPALLLLSEQLDDAQRPVFAARVLAACGLPAERAAGEAERLLASDTLWPGLRELLADWQSAGARRTPDAGRRRVARTAVIRPARLRPDLATAGRTPAADSSARPA